MSNTLTEPLYQGGPTVDDLHAGDTIWSIPLEALDYYLDAVGAGPDRQLTRRHEDLARHGGVNLRDTARTIAGLPPLWNQREVDLSPDAARQARAVITDSRAIADPRYGWPGDIPDLVGFSLHLHYRERAMQQLQQAQLLDTINANTIHCALCGDPAPGGGDLCATCRPVVDHAQLLATCNEKLNGRTRLEHAMSYLEQTR